MISCFELAMQQLNKQKQTVSRRRSKCSDCGLLTLADCLIAFGLQQVGTGMQQQPFQAFSVVRGSTTTISHCTLSLAEEHDSWHSVQEIITPHSWEALGALMVELHASLVHPASGQHSCWQSKRSASALLPPSNTLYVAVWACLSTCILCKCGPALT